MRPALPVFDKHEIGRLVLILKDMDIDAAVVGPGVGHDFPPQRFHRLGASGLGAQFHYDCDCHGFPFRLIPPAMAGRLRLLLIGPLYLLSTTAVPVIQDRLQYPFF